MENILIATLPRSNMMTVTECRLRPDRKLIGTSLCIGGVRDDVGVFCLCRIIVRCFLYDKDGTHGRLCFTGSIKEMEVTLTAHSRPVCVEVATGCSTEVRVGEVMIFILKATS